MPTTGDPNYLAELDRARQLHIDKAAGYTGDNPDAWSNFREATNWGSTPLDGCFIRMGDKYKRAQNVYRNSDHDKVGESLIDTLRDLAAYALIGVCLILESQETEEIREARLRDKVEHVFGVLAEVNGGHDEKVREARLVETGWTQQPWSSAWDAQVGNHTHGVLISDLTHSHAGQTGLHRHSASR